MMTKGKGREGLISRFTGNEHGFTLMELLVAVSVLVIISGAAYTAFDVAIDVYRESESRMMMTQKCRIALDQIVTDLSHLQAVQGDEAFILVSQDNPGEAGDQDMISFVTLIHTDPDPFLAQLNVAAETGVADQENQVAAGLSLQSDVQRVAYYIGPDPSQQVEGNESPGRRSGQENSELRVPMLTEGIEETQEPALLRVATTALNPETVIQPLLETGTAPTEDEDSNPIYVDIVPISDQIAAFDVKYFDGEDWYDSWEDAETIPKSVQVWIAVAPRDSQRGQNTLPDTVTQSTMVYLLMGANFSEQPAGGAPVGGPGG